MIKIKMFLDIHGQLQNVGAVEEVLNVKNSQYIYGCLEILLYDRVVFSCADSDDDIVFFVSLFVNALTDLNESAEAEFYFPSVPKTMFFKRNHNDLVLSVQIYGDQFADIEIKYEYLAFIAEIKESCLYFFERMKRINPVDQDNYSFKIERIKKLI